MGTTLPVTTSRILNPKLERKIMSAETAASLIQTDDQIGMSGFTGSGYPKAVPVELAKRIADAHFRGEKFQVSVFTGASTGPELDGALAMAGGIHLRLPLHSAGVTSIPTSPPSFLFIVYPGSQSYRDFHTVERGFHLLTTDTRWRTIHAFY